MKGKKLGKQSQHVRRVATKRGVKRVMINLGHRKKKVKKKLEYPVDKKKHSDDKLKEVLDKLEELSETKKNIEAAKKKISKGDIMSFDDAFSYADKIAKEKDMHNNDYIIDYLDSLRSSKVSQRRTLLDKLDSFDYDEADIQEDLNKVNAEIKKIEKQMVRR